MSDGILSILQFAIDGVTAQQNAVANNIANDETPGFRATDVSFESSLAQAISLGGPATAEITTQASSVPAASDGNDVRLSDELVAAQTDTLQYQAISESLNSQFRLIQGAAGGSYT